MIVSAQKIQQPREGTEPYAAASLSPEVRAFVPGRYPGQGLPNRAVDLRGCLSVVPAVTDGKRNGRCHAKRDGLVSVPGRGPA